MHLNKILEQIKRHQSPTEAIDKLATALEKHEGSLLEKGFTILKSELAAKGWKWLRSWKPSRNKFGFRSFSCYG